MISQPQNRKNRILLAGGGTGGHIYPALAIAQALLDISSQTDILFVGAKGGMEEEKVVKAGHSIKSIRISGFDRKLFTYRNLIFPFKLIYSLLQSSFILDKFRPHVAVGVGGYASGPVLYQAAKRKIPCLIQEQNSYPGITNRLLAPKVKKICLGMQEASRYFPESKCIYTGNPVRPSIGRKDRKTSLGYFNLSENRKTVLSVGGSLGAGTLNRAMLKNLRKFKEANIQIIWLTGKRDYADILCGLPENEKDFIRVYSFLEDMALAYAAADIIISRAGALSLAELAIIGKPVILIPSPNVAEDHQTKNAAAMASKHAAILVRDSEAEDILANRVLEILHDEAKQKALSGEISRFAKPSAAMEIAKEILSLAE